MHADTPALRGMLGTLDKVNGEAKSVADYARSVEGTGGELTPGEVVQPVGPAGLEVVLDDQRRRIGGGFAGIGPAQGVVHGGHVRASG